MTRKEKERVLKLIEIYKMAINENLDAELSIGCGICANLASSHIEVVTKWPDNIEEFREGLNAYISWESFDKNIKEIEKYINKNKGVSE